jgi:acyl-CoA synthetase (AMP-forming)/AMP-acid ligase II
MKSLLQLLSERDHASPAIVKGAQVVQTGQLLQESLQLARQFIRLGMQPGDTAVLAAMPDAGFVRLIYAAMQTGIRLAIIDPEMGRENYREKLRQLNPRWAFVDYRLLLLQEHPLLRWLYFKCSKKGIYFPKTPQIRVIACGKWMPVFQKHIRLASLSRSNEDHIPLPPLAFDRDFLITYTSGTTSLPKGVLHSTGAITASILQIARLLEGSQNKRIATHLPYFAIIGLNAGVEAFLWEYRLSALEQIQFIEKHRITTLFSPPCDYLPMIEYCEQTGRLFPACLQHLFFGSAPVHRAFLERILSVLPEHVQLTCLYGMTENLLVAAIDGREKALLPTNTGDILGRPVPEVDIKIASDGEILLKSPQLYTRYLHLDQREEWHASGDLGCIDAEGRLVLTGRKKDMIIRRNFNLYPGLYEPTINRIPGVTECAMAGVYHPERHDEVVALFVETHRPISERELRKALEYGPFSIDREALPDEIIFQKLPRSGRQNKVDKNTLREQLKARLSL